MLGLKIFFRVQTFRLRPFAPSHIFYHPAPQRRDSVASGNVLVINWWFEEYVAMALDVTRFHEPWSIPCWNGLNLVEWIFTTESVKWHIGQGSLTHGEVGKARGQNAPPNSTPIQERPEGCIKASPGAIWPVSCKTHSRQKVTDLSWLIMTTLSRGRHTM